MTLPHEIRPEAEADLDETYRWYERQREGLGGTSYCVLRKHSRRCAATLIYTH